jgi:hypothetical protein
VIYAPEGLGKTTLASLLPSPIFFDFEGGTHHVDVARLEPSTLAEFEKWARELVKDKQDFRTVVVDTVDWLEEAVVRQVIADAASDNVKSIEDFGFGKGWVHLGERMNHVLSIFDRLIDAGLHVVCLAHCAVRRFDDPKLSSGYDRYELKMYKDRANAKGTAALLKEWADALLFGTFEDKVKPGAADGARGRAVAASGKERVLFCSHSAAWDAKNRHGLKDKEPWSVETLMRVLGNPAPVTPGKSGVAAPVAVTGKSTSVHGAEKPMTAAPKPVPANALEAAMIEEGVSENQVMGLRKAAEASRAEGIKRVALTDEAESVAVEETPAADSPGDAVVFVTELPKSDDPIEGIEEHEEPDEELDRMLSPHAQEVNLFLRDKQKVGPYQSYRSMPPAYRTQVLSNPSGFLARVKAYAAEGRAA